jgi:predicted transcriptional regulator of viral defense system
MRARDYIDDLASKGRYHFSSDEAVEAIGSSLVAVRARLRRLKREGLLAEPARGFHLIIPPEYRRLRCLPAEHFIDQFMKLRGEPYYVALLSAAERHGAAHQRPQVCQVMVRKNRKALICGQVRVEFLARSDLENMPTIKINTPRGTLRYSTPEVTALELVGYPNHAGGLGNAVTVLSELVHELDADKLLEAARLCPLSWSQRLGFIFEVVGQGAFANPLAQFVQEHGSSYTPLRRSAPTAGATRNSKWKLIVNAELEPDA